MSAPNELPATEAAAKITSGELTSLKLVTACLERIDAREPTVQAWAAIDRERVLAEAKARDGEKPRGPLHGVPVGVKDLIDTADLPTEYGSPMYKGNRPGADAACVALVRRAGGIIMGKTVTTEFATITPPRTTHPLNPRHTPGGSSSGSAAAVADRQVPVAFGTQTAGSLNRPAAFCGTVGFKPSFGAYSVAGIKLLSQSLDTLGTITRTVDDALLMWEVLHGTSVRAPTLPARPRIALCRTPFWNQAQPETHAAWKLAGQKLAAAGFALEEIDLPKWFETLVQAQKIVQAYETSRSFAFEYEPARRAHLSAQLLDGIEQGWKIPHQDYVQARSDAARAQHEFDAIACNHDGIMMPVTPGEAPDPTTTGDSLFSRLPSLLHAPALNLNVTKGPNGLPVGVQFVGRRDSDLNLLTVGRRIAELLA